MRRSITTFIIIGWSAISSAAAPAAGVATIFNAPTWDSPGYQILIPLQVSEAPLTVKEVRINGSTTESFRIMPAGKPVVVSNPLEKGIYFIVLDYAWSSSKYYLLDVLVHGSDPQAMEKRQYSGTGLRSGGVPPGSAEGFHRVFKIEETAGVARTDEVVELVVTAARAAVPVAEFRVFDGMKELPCEVIGVHSSDPVEKVVNANPPTVTAKLACPVSVAAKGRKLLLVLRGKPQVAPPGGIALAGEGLGKTLTTPRLVLGFHPKSGQILTIDAVKEGVKLWNKAGVIHWNPDVFVPGVAWDHSFDWNPPAAFEEKAGAFLYLNSRRGPMPRVKDVLLEVRYRVDPYTPGFISETLMTFVKDLGTIAVRNDEMVLYKELFDACMYRALDGRVVTGPLAELPEKPFGLAHIAPPDLAWVGLVNTKEKFGFFSLRLASAASSLGLGGDFALKAGTYFYAPSDGDYVYWVRPLVYTWGDFATSSLVSFVPAGSFFYEKNAYVVLRLDEGTPAELDRLARALREPLRVF
mgnify:CR=1 FL=1